MRRGWAALLLTLLVASVAVPTTRGHTIGDPGDVNFLLDHFSWPDLEPGETGTIRLTFTNTYPWNMSGVLLRFEIYRYVELDRDLAVNSTGWPGPGPDFVDSGFNYGQGFAPPVLGPNRTGTFLPGESEEIAFAVVTYPNTLHGGLTNQGSYFVRSLLEFDTSDGVTTNRSLMMSKGFFSDAEFERARMAEGEACPVGHYCEGILDLTELANTTAVQGREPGRNHLDGVTPDGAFSVTERMPLWPYIAVGGVMVAALVFAVLFYAEENPGKYPRLARWWLAVKGRARSARPPRSK